MIDHYTIYADPEALATQWSIKMEPLFKPTFNAQPTQRLPVISNVASDTISLFHWGVIPGMAKKRTVSPRLLAVDAHELQAKAIYQSNLLRQRCVIPMQGYYRSRPIGKKKSSPMYVFLNNHQPVAVAGLWSQFDDFDGNIHFTFKILVQPAEGEYTLFGDWVPVLVPKADVSKWLSDGPSFEQLYDTLTLPEWSSMGTYAVSPRIFEAGQDDEDLIKATRPTDQHGNYTLFE